MKKLSRNEMKKVIGGNPPANGCGEYEGQTTYYCGWRNAGGQCYVDICFCNGNPVPNGCDVPYEGPCGVS